MEQELLQVNKKISLMNTVSTFYQTMSCNIQYPKKKEFLRFREDEEEETTSFPWDLLHACSKVFLLIDLL